MTFSVAPGQRLAVLVDTANMYHSAREQFSGRLDYRRLLETISASRSLVRAIAFVVRAEDVDVTPFLNALENAGFETRTKVLPRRPDGSVRGSWDVGIALAAATLAPRVDAIALVSGDGDFAELMDYLRVRGCRAEVHGVEGHVSNALIDSADDFSIIGPELMLSRT